MKSANIFCKHWPRRAELLISGSQEAGAGRGFTRHSSGVRRLLSLACWISAGRLPGNHCMKNSPQIRIGPPRGVGHCRTIFSGEHSRLAEGSQMTGAGPLVLVVKKNNQKKNLSSAIQPNFAYTRVFQKQTRMCFPRWGWGGEAAVTVTLAGCRAIPTTGISCTWVPPPVNPCQATIMIQGIPQGQEQAGLTQRRRRGFRESS